ncbi:4Fe-4S binding protein [Methanobacterium aggregans]|uniref:4Fe-4S binding protein n=1 Tax=Methanobacterium aggregans TaxID=1615586 RepID=UPI001AE4A200|nr:4Fe-4S binding protein [Methanobacterium aggregans]MBP2046924.1 epoxyqueuosine reductase QueG [Methanobacterium aggregans]
MANDKKGCCGDAESKEVPIKEKSTESCCGSEDTDLEEDEECGCGCGGFKYPDTSTKNNPNKPKFIADYEFFKEFENYAYSLGFKSVGYTQLTPDLLTKNKFMQYTNTIVLTIEMNKEIIETPPGEEAQRLNDLAYEKTGHLTYMLSDYLREKGYATEIAHSYDSIVKLSSLAQKAGLGFIGNNGLLITPELGSRLKISAITVSIANLPMKDENEHAWIPEYCEKCGKCVKACPHEALIEKETCCGGKEVEFVRKQCIGCSQGCTYCIEACPFDEKGYAHVKNKFDKMNAKLKEKQNKKFKPELWSNWAEKNSQMFAGLVNGATIAISMAQNEEKLILLEKADHDLNVSIKELEELERPVADLMFLIDEKDIKEILNDTASIKFMDMLSSGKIKVYGFISQTQLIDKGYMAFLNRLGLSLGGGGCCC